MSKVESRDVELEKDLARVYPGGGGARTRVKRNGGSLNP